MVHVLKDRHSLQEIFILLSLLLRCFLHNVVESSSVKHPELSVRLSSDGSSSWGVVQQSKFSEDVSWSVVLEMLGLSVDDLVAAETSSLDDVEHISWFSFLDDSFTIFKTLLVHGVDHDLHVFFIKAHEHECTSHSLVDLLLDSCILSNDLGLESSLRVVLSKDLSTN